MAEEKLLKSALNKAMAICARKECCISEISNKLDSWGVDETSAGKVIFNLVKDKFIDEERYSKAFARDKFRYYKWGRLKIRAGLIQKRIPENVINTALEVIDEKEYLDQIQILITSHRKKIKAKNQYDLKGKLMRYGLSKGFESHLLYDLLNDL
jgi:regulatory protein